MGDGMFFGMLWCIKRRGDKVYDCPVKFISSSSRSARVVWFSDVSAQLAGKMAPKQLHGNFHQ